MGFFDANRNCWSGLTSKNQWHLQEGLRKVCRDAGDFTFHSSMSGYYGWDRVAASTIRRRPKRIVAMGHSNGGYAITALANAVETAGVEVVLVCFDRTLKPCLPLGSNVVAALDLWAGLRNLERGVGFKGELIRKDFSPLSHSGVIADPDAQQIAIDFIKEWAE